MYNFVYLTGLGFKGLKSYLGIEGAHNMYLGTLVDFGLPFGVFYFPVLFIIHLVLTCKILKRKLKSLFVSMMVLLFVEAMVHEPLYHYKILALYFLILFSLLKGEYVENYSCSRLAHHISRSGKSFRIAL
jgi:hypothetical protein